MNPGFLNAHVNLGAALRDQGKPGEAIAEHHAALRLNPALPAAHFNFAVALSDQGKCDEAIAEYRAGLRLEPRDPGRTPISPGCCSTRGSWTRRSLKSGYRYKAACSAASAGSGQGKDDTPLDEPAKARWRKQAIDWLNANMRALSQLLDKFPLHSRQVVCRMLGHRKADPDLAGIRDAAALSKLSPEEQKSCQSLWAEADALLAKARGSTAP